MSSFDEIAAQTNPAVAALARRARELILAVMPDAVEVVWPRQKIASYGVGPKKMSEHFCYVGLLKERINLGFYYGADLEDPAGLLEGTGKLLRHIKIERVQQLEEPAIRRLVEASSGYLPRLRT